MDLELARDAVFGCDAARAESDVLSMFPVGLQSRVTTDFGPFGHRVGRAHKAQNHASGRERIPLRAVYIGPAISELPRYAAEEATASIRYRSSGNMGGRTIYRKQLHQERQAEEDLALDLPPPGRTPLDFTAA